MTDKVGIGLHASKAPPICTNDRINGKSLILDAPSLPFAMNSAAVHASRRPLRLNWHSPSSCSRLACHSVSDIVNSLPAGTKWKIATNRPLCESEIHFSSSLCLKARLFFEGPSYNSGGDCEVSIVAIACKLPLEQSHHPIPTSSLLLSRWKTLRSDVMYGYC